MSTRFGNGCTVAHDIDIDSQQAQELIVCMYAEFARACYDTAQVFAAHATTGEQQVSSNRAANDDVLIEDLIHAVRREAMHSGGFVARIRPLLRFVLLYGQLPQSGNFAEQYDVDRVDIARVFQHHAGVRRLMQQEASSALLGDYMFACMTTGRTITDIADAAADWRRPLVGLAESGTAAGTAAASADGTPRTSRSSDDESTGDDEAPASSVGSMAAESGSTSVDDAYSDWNYFGRGLCQCRLCQSIQLARVAWRSYRPTNDIDQHLKQFCDSFEQRLTDVAVQLA